MREEAEIVVKQIQDTVSQLPFNQEPSTEQQTARSVDSRPNEGIVTQEFNLKEIGRHLVSEQEEDC
jgi:hypothetical protein